MSFSRENGIWHVCKNRERIQTLSPTLEWEERCRQSATIAAADNSKEKRACAERSHSLISMKSCLFSTRALPRLLPSSIILRHVKHANTKQRETHGIITRAVEGLLLLLLLHESHVCFQMKS